MFIKYYTSNTATDSDTALLVETVNSEMSKKLKRKVSHAIFDEDGDLHQFSQSVINMWCISKFFTVAFDDDVEALEETEKWIKGQYGTDNLQESHYDDEPSPFETYEAYVASDMEDILNERGIRGRGHDRYLDTLDKDLQIRKELRRFFDEDVDEEEAAERLIDLIDQNGVNEDFSMGVEGPTGLNQGIPHGGPGKGVIPAPLFGKGKPMSREDQKEDKKKLKKALDALDLYGVKVKKVTEAMPEYFCRNPWTVDDVDHYLYHDLGFESGEVDDLIALNLDLINELLEKGKSPEQIADELDYSTVQDAED